MPLEIVLVDAPFRQWGMGFIREFKENSSHGHNWIIIATDYFTKWVEVIPTKAVTNQVVMDFLEDKIINRFGVPTKIVTDNAKAFDSMALTSLCNKYGIILSHSSNYYPQGNDQVESSNKNLIMVIKRTMDNHKRDWDNKIKYALWVDRTTVKASTGFSPFNWYMNLRPSYPCSSNYLSLNA